ncbi:MAG TPA: DUF4129 domain-containing protein [Chloroflexota bacterium]|nr:DUF4129 domain-containing protein [Chloroflexota bacterium]
MTLGQYRARVHALRIRIDHLSPRDRTRTLKAASIDMLRLNTVVRIGNRRLMAVTPGVLGPLDPHRPTLFITRARVRVDQLDDALRGPTPPAPSRAQLAALHMVLMESQFHPQQSLWDQIVLWLAQGLTGLIRRLQQLIAGQSGGISLLGLLAILAVALLVLLLGRAAMRRSSPQVDVSISGGGRVTSSQARREAAHLAAAGEYREALHLLLLSVLLELEYEGRLELRPGLTNREYLRLLQITPENDTSPLPPERLRAITRLVELFDAAWYGRLHVDEGRYQDADELAHLAFGHLPGSRAA